MNKKDLLLIIILFTVAILLFFFIKQEEGKYAFVYYNNKLNLKIDLNKNNEYDVKGYNGNIHIIVKDGYLKVTDEISPYHLCQNKKIHNLGESIICLPNKVIIKIEDSELDAIVGD